MAKWLNLKFSELSLWMVSDNYHRNWAIFQLTFCCFQSIHSAFWRIEIFLQRCYDRFLDHWIWPKELIKGDRYIALSMISLLRFWQWYRYITSEMNLCEWISSEFHWFWQLKFHELYKYISSELHWFWQLKLQELHNRLAVSCTDLCNSKFLTLGK